MEVMHVLKCFSVGNAEVSSSGNKSQRCLCVVLHLDSTIYVAETHLFGQALGRIQCGDIVQTRQCSFVSKTLVRVYDFVQCDVSTVQVFQARYVESNVGSTLIDAYCNSKTPLVPLCNAVSLCGPGDKKCCLAGVLMSVHDKRSEKGTWYKVATLRHRDAKVTLRAFGSSGHWPKVGEPVLVLTRASVFNERPSFASFQAPLLCPMCLQVEDLNNWAASQECSKIVEDTNKLYSVAGCPSLCSKECQSTTEATKGCTRRRK